MAVKYTCDSCGEEVPDGNLLYKISVKNSNDIAIMNENNTPDLCEDCAKLLLSNWLPKEIPVVESSTISEECIV